MNTINNLYIKLWYNLQDKCKIMQYKWIIQEENNIVIWSEVKTTNDSIIHECRSVKRNKNKKIVQPRGKINE